MKMFCIYYFAIMTLYHDPPTCPTLFFSISLDLELKRVLRFSLLGHVILSTSCRRRSISISSQRDIEARPT